MLIVVRHGRTAANAQGLLQGRVDNPLDDEGRRQADAIAAAIAGVDARESGSEAVGGTGELRHGATEEIDLDRR